MLLEYTRQPCEWPPTYPAKRDGWIGGKISKNCPVGRNKISTEWLDVCSWELCKLVKSLHTTPGHPKHQLSWGKNCRPALFQVYSHVTLLKLHFATFEIIVAVYWRKLNYIQWRQNTKEWLYCGIFGWPCSFFSVIRYLLVISHWTSRIKFVTLFFNTSVILILLFLLWRLLILTWPLQKLSRLQEKWTLMVRLIRVILFFQHVQLFS